MKGLGSSGITQPEGSEVSELSHAWILRYKTCLYALVEDFMVAGGMWRKMITSRHGLEKKRGRKRGGGDTSRKLESQNGGGHRSSWVF